MCIYYGFKNLSSSIAMTYLEEYKKACDKGQYQRAANKINKAIKELQKIKENVLLFAKHDMSPRKTRFRFTEAKINKLKILNDNLRAIEEQIKTELIKINQELNARIKDPSDFLYDYEIETIFEFYLDENDLEYDEDDMGSNILFELKSDGKMLFDEEEISLEIESSNINDWNDMSILREFKHCELFHSLYDHIEPHFYSWDDLLRINCVWIDINVIHQVKYDV